MIDSNETLAYQASRESGYDYGYCDGVVEFAEYLRMQPFCAILTIGIVLTQLM